MFTFVFLCFYECIYSIYLSYLHYQDAFELKILSTRKNIVVETYLFNMRVDAKPID